MQDEAVIRNLIAEKGWKILSLENSPVTDTSKGKGGGIKLVLDTTVAKCPDVRWIVVPPTLSGQIKDGVIRTFVPRDILSLIRLIPSIINHCSGYSHSNVACSLRLKCEMNKEFFRKVKDRELSYGLSRPFVGTAHFTISGEETKCSNYKQEK